MFVQIPGYPRYLIDENGTVVSTVGGKWGVLKPQKGPNGYQIIALGHGNTFLIHRLVMLAWIGPSDLIVNHKNGIKDDNRLENLEYVTHSENHRHAYRTGLRCGKGAPGEKNTKAKLSDVRAAQLLALKGTTTQTEAGKLFNVSQVAVSQLWLGKTWKHLHQSHQTNPPQY
jgi:hypothetical protein